MRLMTAPPLVAHVIFRLDIGGLENGVVNLLNHMPPERYRHAIVCLTEHTDFRARLRRDDVSLHALHKRPGKDAGWYLRLWQCMRALIPDIVHTRNLTTLEALVPAAFAGVRHRVHGEHGWDLDDLHGTRRRYRILRRGLSPFVSQYVTVSRDLRGWLEREIAVPATRITQICNGVDTSLFRPPAAGREALPAAGFAGAGTVVIGTVGRMTGIKSPLTLARAFVELLDSEPDARKRLRLVLVGDGPELASVRALLADAGAADLAWLPGARDDVPQLMRAMDLFVLSSLNEGISNTILEAMASGLPIVATNVGGNAELVRDGGTGILVPPGDPAALAAALRRYLRDPALREAHALAARERALADFSMEAMVRGYLDVYDRLLGRESLAHAA
jgi:sugar transferase (PEP-CTERM/EpsH1 system associated)